MATRTFTALPRGGGIPTTGKGVAFAGFQQSRPLGTVASGPATGSIAPAGGSVSIASAGGSGPSFAPDRP
jgi:hypothetical protein